ncbi:MAG: hypothetical protein KY469_17090 [Actinobacteria bacterium]|nr:hypothetical protein [Actinomycetota bacterium]
MRRGLPPPEEQYALLLDGVLSDDDVGPELAALALLVQPLRAVPLAPPDPVFRADLRQRLELSVPVPGVLQRVRDGIWERTARWRYSLRVATASAMAASMVGTAGVAAVAQYALPGELLYPVKQATETVRMALAGDLEAVGRLHLRFAEERLEEVTDGATSLRSDLLVDALADMDESSRRGSDDLLTVFALEGQVEALDVISGFLEQQRSGLGQVVELLPMDVQPFAQRSLEVLAAIENRVEAAACGCDPDGAGPLPAPRASTIDGAVSDPLSNDAVTTCECVPAREPRPPREPSSTPPDDPVQPPPSDDPAPREPPREEPPRDDDRPTPPDEPDRVVVPRLPGPLDPIGETVDGVIGGVLDRTGTPPPLDGPPVEELPPPDLTPTR